jgi:hypothetical protein
MGCKAELAFFEGRLLPILFLVMLRHSTFSSFENANFGVECGLAHNVRNGCATGAGNELSDGQDIANC